MNRRRPAAIPLAAWRARWLRLSHRSRRLLVGAAAVLLVAVLAVLVCRDALGRWLWPDPRYDALRQRAELALQEGRLSANDGSGARELFEAALALQPDQLQAREGLERVAQAALARAQTAVNRGDLAKANAALQLARQLQAPQARSERIQKQMQAMTASAQTIESLLVRAQAAFAQGHLDDGADAALPLYQSVLQRQPHNPHALEGREDVLDVLTKPATQVLAKGDLLQIARMLQRVEAADPGHPVLPALHAGLTRGLERRSKQIRRMQQRKQWQSAANACAQLQALPAVTLPEVCTHARNEALPHTPHTPQVQHAAQATQRAAHACHRAAMRDNNLGRARACLETWRQLNPNDAGLLAAQRQLAERWLAVGDERLRGGDVRGARTALLRARAVDADVPGSNALAQRLQRIQPSLK